MGGVRNRHRNHRRHHHGVVRRSARRVQLAVSVLHVRARFYTRATCRRVHMEASHGQNEHDEGEEFQWNKLLWICAITVFASTAFFVVMVQLGFLLTQRGYASPRLIGMGAAISALAFPVGAVIFRVLRVPVAAKLALSFAFSAAGFYIVALSHTYSVTILGATVNGLGCGMVLPTLITWALS